MKIVADYFLDEQNKLNKQHLFYFIFSLIGVVLIHFFLICIHELSHLFIARIVNVKIIRINISFFNSYISIENISGLKAQLIFISGSIGSIIMGIILSSIIYYNKRLHFFPFLLLFSIVFFRILLELGSWIFFDIGLTNLKLDSVAFLRETPNINPLIVKHVVIPFFVFTIFLFLLLCFRKYKIALKKYEEKAQNSS